METLQCHLTLIKMAKKLDDAVTKYREAWRKKMDEVILISANAEQEEIVDQPEIVKGLFVSVSLHRRGRPAARNVTGEVKLITNGEFGGAPED